MNMQMVPQAALKQQLNPQMLRSLEILRMPLVELRSHICEAILENPMLELEPAEDVLQGAEEEFTGAEAPSMEEIEFGELWNLKNAHMDMHDKFATVRREQTFGAMLKEQIGAMHLPGDFQALCVYLVDCLDSRGYLADPPEIIADGSGCSLDSVMQAVYLLQSLQPVGTGARNLQECLLLQLAEGNAFNAHTIKLVKDGLPLLARQDYKAVARLLGCEKAQALEACTAVKQLNPVPSRGYYTGEETGVIVPDAEVRYSGGKFTVLLNEKALPSVEVSKEYSNLLHTCADKETERYLKDNLAEAKSLISAVEMRSNTLARILQFAVSRQTRFFMDGQSLQPMTMALVAGELDIHPSTVGRAVNGKYLVCCAGTIPLKSLFSTPVREGQNTVSATFVKSKIRQFIQNEDRRHPLSDEALRNALDSVGIKVSRRVIAKYREELNILSSSKRKDYK